MSEPCEARLKRLDDLHGVKQWRIVCGRHMSNGQICPGSLGAVQIGVPGWTPAPLETLQALEGKRDTPRVYAINRKGFRADKDGRYHVIAWTGKAEAVEAKTRRRLPNVLGKGREIIGQYPALPAEIVCPKCQAVNFVSVPRGTWYDQYLES